ncbi:putative beta-1,3-galactosyltransferase 2, partial [Mucuna pruriens]
MTWKSRGDLLPKSVMSQKCVIFLCIGFFCAGMVFTNRIWTIPEPKGLARTTAMEAEKLNVVSEGCNSRIVSIVTFPPCLISFNNFVLQEKEVKRENKGIYGAVFKTQNAIQTLDKTISNLEMELAAAKAAQESIRSGAPVPEDIKMTESIGRRRYLMVIGINTAFSSRKRRDSVRETWMPQ